MAKIRYNLGRIAFNDRGVYSNSETYVKWDFVTSVDSTYLYINESAGINKLINDPSYWKCIADGKPSTLAAAAANLAKAATIQATTDAIQTNTDIQTAEGIRVGKENIRISNETNRVSQESSRVTVENSRVLNETTRTNQETGRVNSETGRVNAETSRTTAEGTRVISETTRGTNETTRQSNETIRTNQETDRVNAEAARVLAGSEVKTNKTSDIESNKTSDDKYPNVKGVNDWSLSKFPLKGVAADYIALYSRKIATVINGVITAIQDTWDAYNSRVVADSAIVKNLDFVKQYYQMCYDNQMFDSIKFAWLGAAGAKFRTSGIYSYFTKIYSLLGGNDATQTTSTNQPYLSGNIAPNEKYGLKNPNGGDNYMTHTPISFTATDKWTVSFKVNFNSNNAFGDNVVGIFIGGINYASTLYMNAEGSSIYFSHSLGNSAAWTVIKKIGKFSYFDLVANGNGTISLYQDGVLNATRTVLTDITISQFMKGYVTDSYEFTGEFSFYAIRSQALNQAQVTAEYNLLRSYIPEIENVVIGTQTWATSNCEMVASPMGNVIPNVTDNTAWASSQTLYDNAYAATAGTDEQKTYAAVKAAAMWCYYDNDVALGAVYGKLYNWFAVKLLQMDIDYYNIANPTAVWGWRVPTSTDLTTLSDYLGGDSVAGGKLKKEGLTYWETPNAGADNSSGFSAIGAGFRLDSGMFTGINSFAGFFLIDNVLSPSSGNTTIINLGFSFLRGYSLRLIKN